MIAHEPPLVISYGNGLSAALEPGQPLRLSTVAWDLPERPDLIALAERQARLDFLRDHLKSFCGLWDKLPRLFLDAYFRDIAEGIRRNRPSLEILASVHGGLFALEDWSFAALCPLPQARWPAAQDAPIDFAFWTGRELHAAFVTSATSLNRAQRAARAGLRERGAIVTELPGAELECAALGYLIARLPAVLGEFWKDVPLPSSPLRIGSLDEILPA
jgi:hypothetical protein